MIIENIRNYFLKCPLIDKKSRINIDYLGVDAVEYTIDSVPSDPILKKYVDGGALKQHLFIFGSREYYGSDTLQNMENSGFYEQLNSWIEEQNSIGNLPILGKNKESTKIEVLTSGYLFDASEETAKYQVQLRLVYYEDY